MSRLRKRVTTAVPNPGAAEGRELLAEQKAENIIAVEGFAVDEAVQYYDEGWRFGHVKELPIKGLNKGRARVEHAVTHRKVWVDGTGLKKV